MLELFNWLKKSSRNRSGYYNCWQPGKVIAWKWATTRCCALNVFFFSPPNAPSWEFALCSITRVCNLLRCDCSHAISALFVLTSITAWLWRLQEYLQHPTAVVSGTTGWMTKNMFSLWISLPCLPLVIIMFYLVWWWGLVFSVPVIKIFKGLLGVCHSHFLHLFLIKLDFWFVSCAVQTGWEIRS